METFEQDSRREGGFTAAPKVPHATPQVQGLPMTAATIRDYVAEHPDCLAEQVAQHFGVTRRAALIKLLLQANQGLLIKTGTEQAWRFSPGRELQRAYRRTPEERRAYKAEFRKRYLVAEAARKRAARAVKPAEPARAPPPARVECRS